jgi:hypothetical protein
LRPAHMADGYRDTNAVAMLEPAALIILKPVAGSLDLDHSVAPLEWPELDQIGKAGTVLA